jgi:hypothetical protein
MQGCTEAGNVSMPPEGSFLPDDIEPVGEVLVRQDGPLRDHRHAIRPTIPLLFHPVPIHCKQTHHASFGS